MWIHNICKNLDEEQILDALLYSRRSRPVLGVTEESYVAVEVYEGGIFWTREWKIEAGGSNVARGLDVPGLYGFDVVAASLLEYRTHSM